MTTRSCSTWRSSTVFLPERRTCSATFQLLPLGPLRGRPVRVDGTSGVDGFGGFNASYIVVEFPVSWLGLTKIINIWATVSAPSAEANGYTQFERMGQPAFNTVFIPKPLKDAFNQGVPSEDVTRWSQFVPDALTTTDNDGTGNTISARAGLLTTLGLMRLRTARRFCCLQLSPTPTKICFASPFCRMCCA